MYEAKQNRVMRRLIECKNSKQLKSFINNKNNTQANSFISTIIQRASLEDWINGARMDKNAPITLYTHVLNDGFGDAGQLGYLVDKMNSLGLGRNVVPYATHDHEHGNKQTIMNLSRIKTENYLAKKKPIAGWIPECENSWEIQYPVPANSVQSQERILRISEMGANFGSIKYKSDKYYHTGIGPGLIDSCMKPEKPTKAIGGYGIPSFIPKPHLYYSMLSSVNLNVSQLKDALLVKVPDKKSINIILEKAFLKGYNTIILLGVTDDETSTVASIDSFIGMTIRSIKFLPQEILTHLMYTIGIDNGKGMIFSAGEGMYVQALGASKAAVGNLSRNENYDYQLWQIKSDSNFLGTNIQQNSHAGIIGCDMMGLDQNTLKQHSDIVRTYNWFDQLNRLRPQKIPRSKSLECITIPFL